MDPLTLAVGTAVGYGASKMLGGKKKSTTMKKRKTTPRKTTARKSTRTSAGINKSTGRLKKGYKYGANGRVVKAKAKR